MSIGCSFFGWSGRYSTEGLPLLSVDVTEGLVIAKVYQEHMSIFVEEARRDLRGRCFLEVGWVWEVFG